MLVRNQWLLSFVCSSLRGSVRTRLHHRSFSASPSLASSASQRTDADSSPKSFQTYSSLGSEVKLEKPKLLQFGKVQGGRDPRWDRLRSLVDEYPSDTPIEEAWTPPASWYTEPEFLSFEKKAVFENCWQYACHVEAVKNPGDFYAGTILGEHFLVVRGADGQLRSFHNVCRHHATVLSPPGTRWVPIELLA